MLVASSKLKHKHGTKMFSGRFTYHFPWMQNLFCVHMSLMSISIDSPIFQSPMYNAKRDWQRQYVCFEVLETAKFTKVYEATRFVHEFSLYCFLIA